MKKVKVSKSAVIRKLFDAGHTPKEIAKKTNYHNSLIHVVIRNYKKKPSRIIAAIKEMKQALDVVNHPPHYKSGGVETIDFIEAKDLNYRLGNVVKYVARAGKKDTDPVQDLQKALWYLQREINTRKEA